MSEADARNWAMGAHLCALAAFVVPVPFVNIIGPLVIWQVKKEESDFVAMHAKEALNFGISMFIYMIFAVLSLFLLVGFILLPALIVFEVVVAILAAVAASRGERYYYPLCIRFVT